MATLNNKIDFAVILTVTNANPNGDPLNGNRPRVTYDGFGEISDVCIKRKIRNRLQAEGFDIFVQSDDNRKDEYRSLKARAEGELKNIETKDEKKYRDAACKKWIDVRSFGQLFAFKGGKTKSKKGSEENEEHAGDQGVSIGIRGPVSVHSAFSVASVNSRVSSTQITKSVSGEGDGSRRGSDTMGMKHRVDHGLYLFYGSMNPQLAEKTGFSDSDADAIKEALRTLFRDDESSARPSGSMEVHRVYWFKHSSRIGQYSSAKVHRLISVKPTVEEPRSVADYEITLAQLQGLRCETLEGE
jgi:CRISPR-associated protein Csd2